MGVRKTIFPLSGRTLKKKPQGVPGKYPLVPPHFFAKINLNLGVVGGHWERGDVQLKTVMSQGYFQVLHQYCLGKKIHDAKLK